MTFTQASHKPVLVIGYGNPSRGDDAIGPEFLALLETEQQTGNLVDCFDTLTDFQLQIEHAMDLQGRRHILFIDASVSAEPPFEFTRLSPIRDDSFSTHALTPQTVLSVFEQMYGESPPDAYLLTIPGYTFELGEPIGHQAVENMQQAVKFVCDLLNKGQLDSAAD